jgi:hypothetical protein
MERNAARDVWQSFLAFSLFCASVKSEKKVERTN